MSTQTAFISTETLDYCRRIIIPAKAGIQRIWLGSGILFLGSEARRVKGLVVHYCSEGPIVSISFVNDQTI
jgi:hypothetical protein